MNAYTFSAYTNAFAIYCGARKLGLKTYYIGSERTFPIPSSKRETTDDDWLFFTEEASLLRALKGEIRGKYHPTFFPPDLLDNKWAMALWLSERPRLAQGLQQWTLAQIKEVTYPCLLKAKSSWHGSTKLPRGWICRNESDVKVVFKNIVGFPEYENLFFFQEWLGDRDCRVVSVCGFHDVDNHERNLVAVVERIDAHSKGLSCSAAVETVQDTWGVHQKTVEILDSLEFTGPYELEFLVVNDRCAVLELNPRFWMQHAIFLENGNGLIKRYLGLDSIQDWKHNKLDNVVWIDGIHLIFSTVRLNFKPLALAVRKFRDKNSRTIVWPAIPIAALVAVLMTLQKVKSKILNLI